MATKCGAADSAEVQRSFGKCPTDGRWAFTRQPLLSTRDDLGNGTLGHTQLTSACLPASSPCIKPFQQRRLILERTLSITRRSRLLMFGSGMCTLPKNNRLLLFTEIQPGSPQTAAHLGALRGTTHGLPGQHHADGGAPPSRGLRPPFQPGEPLQPQSLALPALFLTSALLSHVPIDKNVFFVWSVIPGLFSVGT